MYIGRFLVAGKTKNGNPFISYRVSSRSFPNRIAVLNDKKDTVSIIPKDYSECLKNPYISYNCIKVGNDFIVGSNGTQTDVIFDKIKLGMPTRDALVYSLITMDYEKDEYNTPRIGTVLSKDGECYLGYVRDDGLSVKKINLKNGIGYYIGVYNSCEILDKQVISINGENSEEICNIIMDKDLFEYPVCSSTCVIKEDGSFDIGIQNK